MHLFARTLLIHFSGPHGTGKTSTVYACATQLGMNVIEISACQQRGGVSIQNRIKEATQSHGLSGDKGVNLILFDEVDIVFQVIFS